MEPAPHKARVFFRSLGCPKNRVDSELMLGALALGGYAIAERIEDADVAVINTCSFIESAREESIDLLSRPFRARVLGDVEVHDAPAIVGEHDKHEEDVERRRRDGEEVAGGVYHDAIERNGLLRCCTCRNSASGATRLVTPRRRPLTGLGNPSSDETRDRSHVPRGAN